MIDTIKYIVQNNFIAGLVLALIAVGAISDPNQLYGDVNSTDLKYLAGAMEIENGNDGGDKYDDIDRLLLTGSVILNRKNSPKWNGDSIEGVILAKDYGYWQYASVTRNGFKTKKASTRTTLLAKYLLIYGPVCPKNVMYQGQSKNGSDVYKRIKVKHEKDELFCYE